MIELQQFICMVNTAEQKRRCKKVNQNYTNQTKKYSTTGNQIKRHAVLLLEKMMYLKVLAYFQVKQRHLLLWDI